MRSVTFGCREWVYQLRDNGRFDHEASAKVKSAFLRSENE